MRALIVPAVLTAAAVVLTACGGEEREPSSAATPSPVASPTAAANGAVPFQTITQGSYSSVVVERAQVFKIDTQAAWADFWERHTSNILPGPEPPAVDFSRRTVLAAVDQQQPTGGYSLELTGIRAADAGLKVTLTRTVPGEGCAVTLAATRPYHVVRTDKVEGEPQLTIQERTRTCQ